MNKKCKYCGKSLPEGYVFDFCDHSHALLFSLDNSNVGGDDLKQNSKEISFEELREKIKEENKEKENEIAKLKGIPIDEALSGIIVNGEKIGDYVKLTCNVCGKQFERSLSDINKAKKRGCLYVYCSKECSEKGQHGTYISQNERQRWKIFSEKMKEKYGDVCEKCGFPENLPNFVRIKDKRGKERRYCDGHHIVEKSEGGPIFDERNVIILCPNCHRLADRKYYSVELLFSFIKKTREKK